MTGERVEYATGIKLKEKVKIMIQFDCMKNKNFGTFFSAVEVDEILEFNAHPNSKLAWLVQFKIYIQSSLSD